MQLSVVKGFLVSHLYNVYALRAVRQTLRYKPIEAFEKCNIFGFYSVGRGA